MPMHCLSKLDMLLRSGRLHAAAKRATAAAARAAAAAPVKKTSPKHENRIMLNTEDGLSCKFNNPRRDMKHE